MAPSNENLETLKEYQFSDTEWQTANIFDDKTLALTIKNIGGTPISVFCINDPTLNVSNLDQYLVDHAIDPVEIGGITYEVSSELNQQVFVKSLSGDGKASIRVYGTVDPTADVTELAKIITELAILLDAHEKNYLNSHKVTKQQVGLGNLPNAVTHIPTDPAYEGDQANNVLVSLSGLRVVLDIITAHIAVIVGNPHKVTKGDVELGNVANYPPATVLEAIDTSNNTVYLTPMTGSVLVKDMVQIVASVKPQTVVNGPIAARIPGWSQYDISVPSNLMELTGNKSLKIKAGLQVAYAYKGKTLISNVLGTDILCNFATTNPDGVTYVHVTLDYKGNIIGWGSAIKVPETGTYMEAHRGDFFNTSTCEMFDGDSNPCIRVYVGKVYFVNNVILQAISVPFGDTVIIPITNPIALGKSALIPNPFIDQVETTALIEYGGKWGETMWNDQTGVIAKPKPNDEYNNIVVQVGSVGYLTGGASSGSPFGESFLTITSPLRMAIKVRKL